MRLASHPQFTPLRGRIAAAPGYVQAWHGRVFRCVELGWARPDYLISGDGTRRYGGRWMGPEVTEAVHAASTEWLALKESRGAFGYYGIAKPRQTPRVIVELEVRLERVFNLTRAGELMAPISIEELLGEDWRKLNEQGQESLSQALGRAAWAGGMEGLLTPSARDRRARNLVWFPKNLHQDSTCEISGKKELEQWIANVPANVHKSG